MAGYRELLVWQKAMDLVQGVYDLSNTFPAHEQLGLTDQIRRSAVSIPSNIAEGHGRKLRRQFVLFLRIAKGSLQGLETQLLIASRLGYADQRQVEDLVNQAEEVSRLTAGLIRSMELGT
ncbi:MAG TPA: four helix bundle protein [Tepidisphaeraceae bacterium]|nr:four helix bundle protein [Tepidisphaeraceae bacterium]